MLLGATESSTASSRQSAVVGSPRRGWNVIKLRLLENGVHRVTAELPIAWIVHHLHARIIAIKCASEILADCFVNASGLCHSCYAETFSLIEVARLTSGTRENALGPKA
jgi:hypothetical protein